MSRRLCPADEAVDLRQPAVKKLSEPDCRSDARRARRRRLSFDAKAVEAVITGWNRDPVSDGERLRETLELRRIVRFEMYSGVTVDVEWRHEHAPSKRAAVAIPHHSRLELEE